MKTDSAQSEKEPSAVTGAYSFGRVVKERFAFRNGKLVQVYPPPNARNLAKPNTLPGSITTAQELSAYIERLSPDSPVTDSLQKEIRSGFKQQQVWYRTQKEHWLGWLSCYDGPGAYGRTDWNRDAKFIYNHIVCPPMLLWLAEAAGLPTEKIREANTAALAAGPRLPSKVGAIRRLIPWSVVEAALVHRTNNPP